MKRIIHNLICSDALCMSNNVNVLQMYEGPYDLCTKSKRAQPTRGWTVAAQRSTNCTHSSCPPQWGPVSTVFCGPAGWLALLLLKAGDVETNPGPQNVKSGSAISATEKSIGSRHRLGATTRSTGCT